jgi:hypothetical protein
MQGKRRKSNFSWPQSVERPAFVFFYLAVSADIEKRPAEILTSENPEGVV